MLIMKTNDLHVTSHVGVALPYFGGDYSANE